MNKGLKLALLTAIISGFSIFINKFAVGSITPPLLFTATKNTIVGVVILFFLLGTGKLSKITTLTKKEKLNLLLVGVIGGALPFYLFFTGISQISAINAALIHKTLVIWVALLAIPLLKEKITKTQALGIFVLFVSNLFVGGFQGFSFSTGELMVLVATVLWSIETIVAKKVLSTVDTDLVVFSRMGLGSLILVVTSFILIPDAVGRIFSLSTIQWFYLVATSLALLGYVSTWYQALKIAPATTVSAVLVGSTIVTNILSALFITKTWGIGLSNNVLFIVLGLTLFIYSELEQVYKKKTTQV